MLKLKRKCSGSQCFMIFDKSQNGEVSQLAGWEPTEAEEKHFDEFE